MLVWQLEDHIAPSNDISRILQCHLCKRAAAQKAMPNAALHSRFDMGLHVVSTTVSKTGGLYLHEGLATSEVKKAAAARAGAAEANGRLKFLLALGHA